MSIFVIQRSIWILTSCIEPQEDVIPVHAPKEDTTAPRRVFLQPFLRFEFPERCVVFCRDNQHGRAGIDILARKDFQEALNVPGISKRAREEAEKGLQQISKP